MNSVDQVLQNIRQREAADIERQKLRAEQESAHQLRQQTANQAEMVQATFEMVEKQQKANELQEESNKLLKEQIDYLKEKNELQEIALKRERKWNIVAWVITSLIAIASIIVPIFTSK